MRVLKLIVNTKVSGLGSYIRILIKINHIKINHIRREVSPLRRGLKWQIYEEIEVWCRIKYEKLYVTVMD